MELATPLKTLVKTLSKSRILVGSGVAPGETQTPIIRIGAGRETEHNPLALVFPLEMTTLWTFQ